MWVIKGLSLGFVVFLVFFVLYFRSFAGPLEPNKAIGFSVIRMFIIENTLFWMAFILTMATCCTYARLLNRQNRS